MSSSQDQRNDLSTPVMVSEPTSFNSCNHHTAATVAPAIITPHQNRMGCEHHNCLCHHHNHHHHHHHNHNHHHPNHQQSAQPQQPHQHQVLLNEPNLELHHPGQHNIPISHQYIAITNPPQNINTTQTQCDYESNLHQNNLDSRNSRFISGDESYPSGSEDSEKRRKRDETRKILKNRLNDQKFTNRIEVYSDGADSGVKVTDDGTSEDDQGPPLPPRPPPRPRNLTLDDIAPHPPGVRKYVIWCLICGGASSLIGVMFLGVYFLLRSYTSSVAYFETVPTFVPATLLMLTGLCIMSLARRRNRYSYLIKLSGACGVASALTCALVTVTTTVLHLSRLQTLRQCEYTQKTRTCTCYTVVLDPQTETIINDDARFVFDSTADCGIVHGALYSCLRAVFGLSVAGVLVAVFGCMLVYQLLSHERKKMYWEQLELRCRSLYSGQPGVPQPPGGPSIIGTPRGGSCRCCEQCHSHRNQMATPAYPWEGDNRFWTPGQTGNFYSPNPGGDEISSNLRPINPPVQRSRGPGWSWPRMPWQRNDPNRFRQTPSSPDSQYGFSNQPEQTIISQGQTGYSVIAPPYGVWGPPPPYSDPNSPARRGRYQYIHPSQCQQINDPIVSSPQQNLTVLECHQHSSSTDSHSMEQFCTQQQQQQQQQLPQTHRSQSKRQNNFKSKENYENTPSDSDGGPRDRFSNTLPVRKTKKRIEIGAKSIGPNQSAQRVNVQNINFQNQNGSGGTISNNGGSSSPETSNNYLETNEPNNNPNMLTTGHTKIRRIKAGVENSAFQSIENEDGKIIEPSESEVYFADVSSCCNISVKNDNYYEDANQRRILKNVEKTDDKFVKDENEDYLVQRFGKRETSIRSRLPFPQMIPEDYEKPQMNLPVVTPRTSIIHKDISRQSMCSIESGEKTDFTDLSPATPSSNILYHRDFCDRDFNDSNQTTNFVASYPYSSNEQSQEAHRRSTKNLQEVLLSSDQQFDNIPLTINYDQDCSSTSSYNKQQQSNSSLQSTGSSQQQQPLSSHFHHSTQSNKPKSPKNLNITPIKRQSLGTNISAIIQNLGGSDVGLLYPDNRRENDIIIETQDCNLNLNNSNISNSCSSNINSNIINNNNINNSNSNINNHKNQQLSDNDWTSDHSDRRL